MQKIVLPKFPVSGGCQCGAVRYTLKARPLGVYNCHCKDCQRFSGAAYTMSMVVKTGDLHLVDGELDTYRKVAASGRVALMHGCPACATRIWNEPLSAPDILVLKPGTLDDSSWARPSGDIWIASKMPWIDLDPALLRFDGQPPSREPLYAAWDAMVG